MSDRLLTANEAAEMLAVRPNTLYQWAYERKISSVKLMGRAVRFKLSEIQRLIKASERHALRTQAEENQGQI